MWNKAPAKGEESTDGQRRFSSPKTSPNPVFPRCLSPKPEFLGLQNRVFHFWAAGTSKTWREGATRVAADATHGPRHRRFLMEAFNGKARVLLGFLSLRFFYGFPRGSQVFLWFS